MTAIAAGRIERSTVPLRTSNGHAGIGKATDKYWGLLFLVAFIILVISGRNVIRPKSDRHNNSGNSTATNILLDLFNNVPNYYETFVNVILEYISHILGKYWLFGAITCNVAFLDVHYENSGMIVILAHLSICGALIIYSFSSMRTEDLYCRQMQIFAYFFLLCTFFTRLLVSSSEKSVTDFFMKHFPLPEIILFIVVCSKLSVLERCINGFTSFDLKPHISITCFMLPTLFWILMYGTSILLSLLSSLSIIAALKNYELSFNNELSSYIFVGAILYMCLTFYYLLLMVSSCASSISFGNEFPDLECIIYVYVMIVRYHFGTACYHATLIFPAIHATFVMNENEFKEIPNFSTIRRFYLTHWKVDDLSMTVTAARGINHAASTREMLRLFICDSPKLKNVQSYKMMFRSLSALFIAINSLMSISLWIHGVPLDNRSVMGVWVTSVIGISIAKLIAQFFDAVADVLWLLNDGTIAFE